MKFSESTLIRQGKAIHVFMSSKIFRWILTILWSLGSLFLFLAPSGDGTSVTFISELFGGTTLTDAIGHVIINSILAFLWYWTLKLYLENPMKIMISVGFVWAVVAELIQLYIPGRSGTLLDMIANSIGIFCGIWLFTKIGKHIE